MIKRTMELTSTVLNTITTAPREYDKLYYYIQCFVNDNILTIRLDNDAKDEISLLFKDGYWEIIGDM